MRAFGDISREILDHLAGQVGAHVAVRVEIVATTADDFPDHLSAS